MSETDKIILGISAFYHDSAAALLINGELVAAAQQERFSRLKHDATFPAEAITFCLSQQHLSVSDLDAIVYYDKPFLTFDRLFESYLSYAPRGVISFVKRMPVWLKQKLLLKHTIRKKFAALANCPVKALPPLLFTQHHQAHAASAFFPSPYAEAAVLCMDGVGEWATTSAWSGKSNQLQPLWQIDFPHSLGLLYSAFTYFCGFKVNSGEYKLMELAPYGKPIYQQLIEDSLIDIKPDGSFQLQMPYFDFIVGNKMTNSLFDDLFNGPARQPESNITQRECDLAASVQAVTEKIVLRLAKTIKLETGSNNICLAGGVALNCSANGKLASSGLFDNIWIQPAAGDAGGAVGGAYVAWHTYFDRPRIANTHDSMHNSYLGPAFSNPDIHGILKNHHAVFSVLEDKELISKTAKLISQGNVIGWFQDNMEFGPRALGNRSILAHPTNAQMQSRMNLKIKFRESFRPFAPSVTEEQASQYFSYGTNNNTVDSPYMLFVAALQEKWLTPVSSDSESKSGLNTIHQARLKLPAITHVDNSARLQTVSARANPRYHALLVEFETLSGFPVLINTSFNIRGEPMVCTPEDAWRCFMVTDMDYLVIGNHLLDKTQQPAIDKEKLMPRNLVMD